MVFRPSTESNGYLMVGGERYYRHRGNGGYVAESAKVDDTVFVDSTSTVHPGAVVIGKVRLEEGTEIGKNSHITGNGLSISRTAIPEATRMNYDGHIHKGRKLRLSA